MTTTSQFFAVCAVYKDGEYSRVPASSQRFDNEYHARLHRDELVRKGAINAFVARLAVVKMTEEREHYMDGTSWGHIISIEDVEEVA